MYENVKADSFRKWVYHPCNNPDETEEFAVLKNVFEEMLMMHRTMKQAVIRGEREKLDKIHDAEYVAEKEIKRKEKEMKPVRDELMEVETDLSQIMKDCENLVRIVREKSCSDRSIKGKKGHSGYVVQKSQEREQTYRYFDETLKTTIWETTIQTPYSVELDFDLVRVQVEIEMTIGDAPLLSKGLGIDHIWKGDADSFFSCMPRKERDTDNYLLNSFFTRDIRSGYWTVTYRHTIPIKNIPTNMLPTE